MRIAIIVFLACLLIFTGTSSSLAGELEELLTGFEDEPAVIDEGEEADRLLDGFDNALRQNNDAPRPNDSDAADKSSLPQWLDLQGRVVFQVVTAFAHDAPGEAKADYRGLSMLRSKGELMGDAALSGWKVRVAARAFYDVAYSVQGRSNYSEELLDAYENELEITEAWLQTSLGEHLDLKTGRQIVVWGKSDNIRITNLLNPLDLRQPGTEDIRDLRLPVAMTKFDYYMDNWNFSSMMIHEPRFSRIPVHNGEFYAGESPAPLAEEPAVSLKNQQYAASANGVFRGWDLSLYAASIFDDRAHVEKEASGEPVRKFSRMVMWGVGTNVARGNWLFKTEAAFLAGLAYSNVLQKDFSRLDVLFGLEYSGFKETMIAVEVANRHIFDFDSLLSFPPDGQQEDLFQSVFRMTRDYLHDTLHFTLLLSTFGLRGEDGAFQRYQLEYETSDNINIKGGVVFYQAGDYPPFREIGENDRLFFEMEYHF